VSDCRLILGDALETLRELPAASVDAVCTDPPAGIGFMGKGWDSFGGRANGNAERDRAAANQGPGAGLGNQPFGYSGAALPKAGQRAAFVAFLTPVLAECLRVARPGAVALVWALPRTSHWTGTAVEDAGWVIEDRIAHLFGTGFPKHKSKLKPAVEDWWVCRKPGPRWLGVEACRVAGEPWKRDTPYKDDIRGGHFHAAKDEKVYECEPQAGNPAGRWPANLALTCCGETPCVAGCPVAELDRQSGQSTARHSGVTKYAYPAERGIYGSDHRVRATTGHGDSGGASRFFFVAKASKKDRGEGNSHPTVKSTALMRWLVRLACPPGGTVLDCFAGSGSTGVACVREGMGFVGIERDPAYFAIADRRVAEARVDLPLFCPSPPA
jgi:site-specific DNA-methyltransferase (adenine-specific)